MAMPHGHAGAQSSGAQIKGGLSNSNTGDSGGEDAQFNTPSSDGDGAGKRWHGISSPVNGAGWQQAWEWWSCDPG